MNSNPGRSPESERAFRKRRYHARRNRLEQEGALATEGGCPVYQPKLPVMFPLERFARVAALILTGALVGGFAAQTPFVSGDMPWPKPGTRHEMLKKLEGEWSASVELFAKAGEPPVQSPGTEKVYSSCNGLWYTVEIDCTEKGLPYQGRGLIGFDPKLNHFTGVWADVTGTTFSQSTGQVSTGDSLVFTGSGPDPRAPDKTVQFRQVMEFPKKNERVGTLYLVDSAGTETKWMRTEYKLKKRR